MFDDVATMIVSISAGAYAGANWMIGEELREVLMDNPKLRTTYENSIVNRNHRVIGLLDYYFGWLGRYWAYRQFDRAHKD